MSSARPPFGVSAQASRAPALARSRAALKSAQAASNAASFSNHTFRCVAGSPANQNSRTSIARVMSLGSGTTERRCGLRWPHLLQEHEAFGTVQFRVEDPRRRRRFHASGSRFLWNLYADLPMYRASGAIPQSADT